ncbi:MAG: phosphopyruvate hydratase [Candidatus Hodarchaeales archaeon]|jgi:enolase
MSFNISKVHAREILDSRGNPTIECDLTTEGGFFGRAAVPSGASTGVNEALELRDGGKRFKGKGVLRAVRNVNDEISKTVVGLDVRKQKDLDQAMITLDGTETKSKLGANAILSVSLAASKAAAAGLKIPLYVHLHSLAFEQEAEAFLLPIPMCNVVNAGKHGGGALELQEFMIQPIGAANFREGIRWVAEVYSDLRTILVEKYGPSVRNVGDEGGFSGPIDKVSDVLDALVSAIEKAGYTPSNDFVLTLDPAASEFFKDGEYTVEGNKMTTGDLIDFYADLIDVYPIRSIEDPLDENDWAGFVEMTKRLGSKIQVVGDDHFVTNTKFIQRGIEEGSCNSLLLKVNQIGSLSESFEATQLCYDNNYSVVVSHRSGETEDPFIADLAVGLGCGQLKTGAPCRSDRNAKYNQLIRIEEELAPEKKRFGLK